MSRPSFATCCVSARHLVTACCGRWCWATDALARWSVLSVAFAWVAFPAGDQTMAADSFATSVAPILIQRCLTCHGGDAVEGGYNLSTLAGLMRAGDSQAAPVVVAEPNASELFRRLVTDDTSERMPSDAPPLSDAEIEAVRQWIVAGSAFTAADGDTRLIDLQLAHSQYPPPPQNYPRPLPVTALALGEAAGPLIVAGYRELLVWRGSHSDVPQRWQGFDVHISAIAITTAGDWLAVAHGTPGQRGEVTLAPLAAAGLDGRSTVFRSADVPTAVAFSPNGDLLAITTHDGKLTVVEVPANQPPRSGQSPTDETTLAQADDSRQRAPAQAKAVKPVVRLDLTPHADAIADVAWSAEGTSLLTASRDRTARVIRLQDGQSTSNYALHDRAVHGVCQIQAGTLTIDETGTLRLWAAGSRTAMLSRQRVSDAALGLHRYQETVLIPASGRILRLSVEQVEQQESGDGDKDAPAKPRKVPQWKELAPLEIDPGDVIVSLAVSPDGGVVAGTQAGQIHRWPDGATAAAPTAQRPHSALPGGPLSD